MKYRNKSTNEIIEAFQYDGDLKDRNGKYYIPDWAIDAFIDGKLHYEANELYLVAHIVNVGDYLVKKAGDIFVSSQKYFESVYTTMVDECGLPFIELSVGGVTEEEIPCCIVDITTAEKLISALADLNSQKDDEIKDLRLELGKLKNFKRDYEIKDKINAIRIELLKHEELYNGFKSSVESAIKAYPQKSKTPISADILSMWILDFVIGE